MTTIDVSGFLDPDVDNSTEVSGASTTTTSFANFASLSLSIPSHWNEWKCEAYATFRWQGDTAGTMDTQIVIDGTAQQTLGPLEPPATNTYIPGAVGGRRTGMTTTGSRTVSVQMRHVSQQMTVDSLYLFARAVRTS